MKMEISIHKGTVSDLDTIWSIIYACSMKMKESGLDHWSSYYDKERVQNMLNEKECFLMLEDEIIVGSFFFSTKPPDYYTENDEQVDYTKMFADPEGTAIYGSALAIHPDYQGKGYARRFMVYREKLANERDIKYIRTDTREDNEEWVQFYRDQDFKEVGEIVEEDATYVLLEKTLKGRN